MKNNKGEILANLIFAIAVIGIVAFLTPKLAVDKEGATRVLQASGYKDISITGYKWFNGTNDFYNTGFIATSPSGIIVSGNVSKGVLFKGSTIRLD